LAAAGPSMLDRGIRAIMSIRPSNSKLLLIEVAEHQFATIGFEATTARAIAQLAGVPVQAIYNLNLRQGFVTVSDAFTRTYSC
jgi:hypothetical protein